MRHFVLIAGLLTALLPSVAAAQCPETETARKLAEAEPLGHYAQLVVERVDKGIEKAKGEESGASVASMFGLHYLITIESIFYMLVDTDLRSVEYKRDLTTVNSCLHYDLAILEAKIEEIRCETVEAYTRKSPAAIRLLKSLANFVNQRYAHLVKGGLEPSHEDLSWQYYYQFDEPFEGWCCVPSSLECQVKSAEECLSATTDEEKVILNFYPNKDLCLTDSACIFAEDSEPEPRHVVQCPFDSDYLASSTNGYGCDLSVLQKIEDGIIEGVDEEVDAIEKLTEERDSFLEDIDHIKETTEKMDEFVNGNMLNEKEREALERFGETAEEEVEHRRIFGCFADLTPEERAELEDEPGEEENRGTEGELTPDIRPSQEWIRIPLRSAFFFQKDHLEIWKAFFRLQVEWAKQREYPDYLKHPDEFPEEKDRREAMGEDGVTRRLFRLPIDYIRSGWEGIHIKQATEEAAILPKAQDMSVQVKEAMAPVRPAMRQNTLLLNSSSRGLRKFGINFAYYLRRSCIYRPCNEKLNTIMQILFSNECFPYATGNDAGSWEACRDAVENLK